MCIYKRKNWLGVDNQSPGLNFSLGNFLGSSELDIMRVEIIQGASSAYYGPNAFNGVIKMETYMIAGFVGPWQVVLIVLAVLILFGGKKIREFESVEEF